MNAVMMPVRSLGLRSAAHLFALWYSLWGAVGGMVFLSSAAVHLTVPLGLFIPFVDLHLISRSPERRPSRSYRPSHVFCSFLCCHRLDLRASYGACL